MGYKKYRDRVNKILAISEEVHGRYANQYDSNKVLPFKNGVDTSRFQPNLNRKYVKGDPQLLFVGNLYPYKNVVELIHCVSELRKSYPSTVLQVVGDGKDFKRLHELVTELGVEKNVELVGRIIDGLEYYYNSCDVYISASKFETCPLTPLEAMACGKPVLLSNIKAHIELVENSNAGLVYEAGNISDMSEKVIILYDERKKYFQNSLKFAKENSWELISQQLIDYYMTVIDEFSE